ncbi:MAG TPA: ATP-binding protein [Phycisphaerales bacterium]|nr:ATP-binding protein [Phycisphaerales bacterium]
MLLTRAAVAESTAEATGATFRAFVHELSNLIEGSTRAVARAKRNLSAEGGDEFGALADLNAAGTALDHMGDLVRSVVDPLGRSRGRGRFGAVDRAMPLSQCIAQAVDVLRATAEERNVRISVRPGEGLDMAPPLPLYTVVSNAVKNAIEASGAGSRVEIIVDAPAEPEGRCRVLRLDILDEGPGPDPAHAGSYFKRGFTTKPGGSGIGLALSREIVTELGGTIELATRRAGSDGASPGGALRIRIPIRSK